jgi:predicted Fe-S protein YdhL (DUF1289 family)
MMTPWTALRQRWQQVQDSPAGAACPSPCMSVCIMKTDADVCWGCLRSIEEVACWSLYTPSEQHQVWQRIGLQITAQSSET